MNRRRFLTVAAAALALPGVVQAETVWEGRAFGADCRIALTGPAAKAEPVLRALPRLVAQIDRMFSLHDPGSILSRLNAVGLGRNLPSSFMELLRVSDVLHRETDGAFDPTVQTVWEALSAGKQIAADVVGWQRVEIAGTVRLGPGQRLTLNGIAQGYAADAVRSLVKNHGFTEAIIDLGEIAVLGGPWTFGIADPIAEVIGQKRLTGSALSVSSPAATLLRGHPHIIHPAGKAAIWSTVAVEAETATLADGLSTAFVFLTRDRIREVRRAFPGVRSVTMIDTDGGLTTV